MTEEQREVNRKNGSLGGPRTPEGKAICAQNARRHSLTARSLVLNAEDESLFQEMLDGYMELFHPANLEEIDLVREIVSGKWRQERWWVIETSILDLAGAESAKEIQGHFTVISENAKIAYALVTRQGEDKALSLVSVYEGRMRRLHERARRDLDRVQSARAPKELRIPKFTKLAPIPEVVAPQPISYRSFISEEEQARLDQGKNRPSIALDLPERDPLDRKKGPKAA